MKNLITVIIATISIVNVLLGQAPLNPDPCVKGISTNPDAPVNPYAPLPELVNKFDWMATTPSGNLVNWPNVDMDSEFQSMLAHPMTGNLPAAYDHLFQGVDDMDKDLYKEQGWELISLNNGFLPNNETLEGKNYVVTPNDLVFFVFYNKYQGTLRVFAVGKNDFEDDFKNVEVTLGYRDPGIAASGLLASSVGKSQALDKKTEVTNLATICPVPGSNSTWFMADFHVDYDPCICKFRSDLEISFKFFKYSNLSLVGRGLEAEVVVDQEGTYVPEDFFSSFDSNSKAGSIVFNNLDKLLDDYEQKLIEYKAILAARKEAIEYNKEIDKKLAVVKMFRSIVINGVTNIISGGLIATVPVSFITSILPQLINEKKVADPTGENDFILEKSINRSKLKSELSKGISAGFDHFAGQLYKKKDVPGEPSKPTQPTATLSEMKFVGDITNDPPSVASLPLFNPGTFGTSFETNQFQPNSYPVYNEVLGLFAMLNTPVVEQYTNSKNKLSEGKDLMFIVTLGNNQNTNRVEVYEAIETSVGFKLKENLKYAFNKALDYESRDVTAYLQVGISNPGEFEAISVNDFVLDGEVALAQLNSTENYSVGLSSLPVDMSEFNFNYSELAIVHKNKTLEKYIVSTNGQPDIISYLSPSYELASNGSYVDTIYVSQDEFESVPTLNDFFFNAFGHYYNDYEKRRYQLDPTFKFNVNIKTSLHAEFLSKNLRGNNNATDRFYTFEADVISNSSEISPEEYFVGNDFTNVASSSQKDIGINTYSNYDGSQKLHFSLDGLTYYFGSKNAVSAKRVRINEFENSRQYGIEPSNGYNVNVTASEKITIEPGTSVIIGPGVELKIIDKFREGSESTSEYIDSFCNGTAYQSYKANEANELVVPDKPVLGKFLSDDSVSLEDSKDNKLPATIAKNQENALSISAIKQPQFYIYPNPTKDIFNIVLTTAEEYVELSISDFSGKTLQIFDYLPKTINLTDYESGVYLLKIINKTGETKVERIIKN